MQTIYLDISNKGVVPVVYAKQGDVGRKFEVVLTDSGLPYIPVSGSSFSVWYSGASGDGNYTDVGDHSAFDINGNKVTVEMIAQMLSNDGDGVLSLVLNNPNGDQIGIWNIPYFCEYVPGFGSEEATEYYTAFSNAVENLPYPDVSLSTPGKAADAEAVGNLTINGKKIRDNPSLNNSDVGAAPAGYGFGEQVYYANLLSLAALDTLYTTCFFAVHEASLVTVNGVNFSSAFGRNLAFMDGRVYQELVMLGSTCKLVRSCFNGTWDAWECENPPMSVGVEYRTTERCRGMPVYTKCVNIGALTRNGTITSSHGITGITNPIDCCIFDDMGVVMGRLTYWHFSTLHVVATMGDYPTSDNAYAILKYLKD